MANTFLLMKVIAQYAYAGLITLLIYLMKVIATKCVSNRSKGKGW